MLFEGFQITEEAVLIGESILIPLCPRSLPYNTSFWDILHINLHSLPRILHFFVRFWNIFRIRELNGKLISFAEKAIQTGDRSGVTALAQFDPEYDQSCVFVAPEHIQYEFDLTLRMLLG